MFELISSNPRAYQSVAFGAILGAYSRLKVSNHLLHNLNQKYFAISIVNILSCFLLGLFSSLKSQCYENCLKDFDYLFFCVGFVGTFGTFSTFILEVFESLIEGKWRLAVTLALVSILGGLLFMYSGILLGRF